MSAERDLLLSRVHEPLAVPSLPGLQTAAPATHPCAEQKSYSQCLVLERFIKCAEQRPCN